MWLTKVYKFYKKESKIAAKSRKRDEDKIKTNGKLPKTKEDIHIILDTTCLPRVPYYGIPWQLEQILTEEISDANDRRKLLQFCQQNLSPMFTRMENTKDSIIHNIVSSLPRVLELESNRYFNTKIIEVLIQNGCDTTKLNFSGDPPIIAAYKLRKSFVVQGFLNTHNDINLSNRFGSTLLILACKENDFETVKRILNAYTNQFAKVALDVVDISQNCAISYVAMNDNLGICKLLLEAGANPNASFNSPLYQAIKNDCSDELIRILINHGAAIDVWVDFTGLNTLIVAATKNRTDVVKMLLDAGAHFSTTWHSNKSFMAALKLDNLRIVLYFMEQGVEIASKTNRGTKIIHEVSVHGSINCLTHFIEKTDMDLNALDRHGKSSFLIAAESGNIKCLESLYKANVFCFHKDLKGMTPLYMSVLNYHKACVEFMLNNLIISRSTVMNTCHELLVVYDQAKFRHLSAINVLRKFTTSCTGESVDSLLNLCILGIRHILGQRSGWKIESLPLPNRIKIVLR